GLRPAASIWGREVVGTRAGTGSSWNQGVHQHQNRMDRIETTPKTKRNGRVNSLSDACHNPRLDGKFTSEEGSWRIHWKWKSTGNATLSTTLPTRHSCMCCTMNSASRAPSMAAEKGSAGLAPY